ncbi:MAG: coenzyme F420-0:L-glutamate ligase [Verrucomicrobiae bacterium]|nr:coenzyme F420-0:L-glutamate ligase [Verrucomicrobiae bacterium]
MDAETPATEARPRKKIEIHGLALPEVKPGDDLARFLAEAAGVACGGIREGDALVVTSKVVSKSAGLLVHFDQVEATPQALRISRAVGGDPRKIQIVLDHSDGVIFALPVEELRDRGLMALEEFTEPGIEIDATVSKNPSMLLVERHGQVCFDAGLDFSNHPEGTGSLPPPDPNRTATELRQAIQSLAGVRKVAVLISDTELSLAGGTVDLARGAAGMQVIDHGMGRPDRFGHPKFGGMDNLAQEMAAAAALLMGQAAEGIPAVLIRGVDFSPSEEDHITGWTKKPADLRSLLWLTLKRSAQALGLRAILRAILGGR